MDFEQNNNRTESTEPQPEKPRKRTGWRIFWGIVIAMSVLANIVLFLALIGVVAVFAAGQKGIFTEEVIQAGPRTAKIAVITVQGIIDTEQANDVYKQLKTARQDERVRGLIIRVNSPGGAVSASDRIYNEILKYRNEKGKPVVAFMQGVAASGGYYVSVGSDKIVAEPTVITGSVGVIAGHFVLQELLEEKLGIQPVIFKSGRKKDWPSPFQPVTEEQRQYIQDKLISPAYNRFVQIVDEGRESLTLADVKRLADGSIYSAPEALDEKLIDEIGYLDEAIEQVKLLAGIEEAQVVEYRKAFSLTDFLYSRSQSFLKIDRAALYELGTPQVLYLWNIY
ncbi:MAG TPA: signal peptide peptidase SppA [Phycisphaerales bacterium]|nr:signal peptide peptidase SppA [Phycisphaerales bacterium]